MSAPVNLNTMEWSISWGLFGMLVREFRLVWLVLRELENVDPE